MSRTKRTSRANWPRRKPSTVAPQLDRAPLVPEAILKRHKAFCRIDSRFRAAARYLQCLYLADRNIPTGSYSYRVGDDNIVTEFGSILAPEAANAGLNFLDKDIYHLALREVLMREDGAYYDEQRLFENALSSQPLTFNLLGKLRLDLGLATRVFSRLFPDLVQTVEHIAFETSPWRRHPTKGLGDGTAFDAAVHAIAPDGQSTTIFIETKFSELMDGPVARFRDKYLEASRAVKLYCDPEDPLLQSAALEQFWREMNLAQLARDEGLTSQAVFMVIAPKLNRRVQTAIQAFQSLLIPAEDQDPHRVAFHPVALESFIDIIRDAGDPEIASQLWGRYCDFERVYETCYQQLTSPSEENTFVQIADALPTSATSEATPRETV
ncbi:MAG: hypothetical protein J0G33_12610 [Afipia felis]|nr:hypothetical protein [Afipia felis]